MTRTNIPLWWLIFYFGPLRLRLRGSACVRVWLACLTSWCVMCPINNFLLLWKFWARVSAFNYKDCGLALLFWRIMQLMQYQVFFLANQFASISWPSSRSMEQTDLKQHGNTRADPTTCCILTRSWHPPTVMPLPWPYQADWRHPRGAPLSHLLAPWHNSRPGSL